MTKSGKVKPPPTPPSDPGTATAGTSPLFGRVQTPTIGGTPSFLSYYHEGDENAPYNYNPDAAYGLMVALVRAGYLSKSALSESWRDTHSAAYKRALADANRYGITIEELLGAMGESGAGGGGGGGGGGGSLGPAPISDEDITALAQKTAQGVLGRDLRPDEIGNFIPAFRGIYEAQETTPQVGAENLIRKEVAPQGEADAHQVGNVMSVLAKALGG